MEKNRITSDVQAVLQESRTMHGALGALAYVVLKGLQTGGADDKLLGSTRILLQEHFAQLSDDDCNLLCDVLYARLQEEAAKPGRWY